MKLFSLERIPGRWGIIITIVQCFITLTSYITETQSAAPYSKFAPLANKKEKKEKKENTSVPFLHRSIASRQGMTMIYTPAWMVSCVMLYYNYYHHHDRNYYTPSAIWFLFIHFTKRLLEVYLVHKYSGSVDLSLSCGIGLYYAWVTSLISYCVENRNKNNNIPADDSSIIWLGSGLFLMGSLGNLYHHYLLSCLRHIPSNRFTNTNITTAQSTKRYMAPKGGWFEYVAAPHYFFELVAWLGIAVISQHWNVYLVFTSMCSYLVGRSVSQNRWNHCEFSEKEWPRSRKNLIPFLF